MVLSTQQSETKVSSSPLDSMGPSFRVWNMSAVRFLFSLSLYSSIGNHFFEILALRLLALSDSWELYIVRLPFTWVGRKVLEVHWFADLPVGRPSELHLDSNGLWEVSVAVRRRAEHDGDLSVDISLGEGALPLPGVLEEAHLNVLCKGVKTIFISS